MGCISFKLWEHELGKQSIQTREVEGTSFYNYDEENRLKGEKERNTEKSRDGLLIRC